MSRYLSESDSTILAGIDAFIARHQSALDEAGALAGFMLRERELIEQGIIPPAPIHPDPESATYFTEIREFHIAQEQFRTALSVLDPIFRRFYGAPQV